MRINVLLFGPQAEMAKANILTVEVETDRASVGSVMAALGVAAPGLGPSLPNSRLAVNHTYAASDDVLSESDEVALIGMVSGG